MCEKEFTKISHDTWQVFKKKKFCSMMCYHKWQDSHRKMRTRYSFKKICLICKKEYDSPFKRESMCSEKCKLKRKRIVRNIHSRKTHEENRKIAIQHYGGTCVCCGETKYEFLAVDHINGRNKEKRLSTRTFYNNFRKGIFPKNYQLLCHNCNCAKGFYGKCPHEQSKYNTKA